MQEPVLNCKDLNKWIKGKNPRELHTQLEMYWEASVEFPEIAMSLINTVSGYKPCDGRIYFNPDLCTKNANFGIRHSISKGVKQYLAALFSEEDTHYMNDQLNPDNMQIFTTLCNDAFNNHNTISLLMGLNIGAQFEAIAKIGRYAIVSKLYPDYDVDKELKLSSESAQLTDDLSIKTEIASEVLSLHPEITHDRKRIKELQAVGLIFAEHYTRNASYAGFKIFPIIRDRFAGKNGELIRKTLESDPSFDQVVEESMDACKSREFYRRLGLQV